MSTPLKELNIRQYVWFQLSWAVPINRSHEMCALIMLTNAIIVSKIAYLLHSWNTHDLL